MTKFEIELYFLDEWGNPGFLEFSREVESLAALVPAIQLEIEETHEGTDLECTAAKIYYDGVLVLELSMQDIIRYVNAVSLDVLDRLDRNQVVMTLLLGSKEYDLQLAELLEKLADAYLQEFNTPDSYLAKKLPAGARHVEDEKRKLQYLTEWCKIAAFQLRGHPASSW